MSSENENITLLPTWMHPWAVDMWAAMEPAARTIQALLEIRRNERITEMDPQELLILDEWISALEEALGDEIYNRLEAITDQCHSELMALIKSHRESAEAHREHELDEAERRAEFEYEGREPDEDWPNDAERALKLLREHYAEHKWDEFSPDNDLYEQAWNILEGKLDEVFPTASDDKHWVLIEYLADNFSYWIEESDPKRDTTSTTP